MNPNAIGFIFRIYFLFLFMYPNCLHDSQSSVRKDIVGCKIDGSGIVLKTCFLKK